MEYHEAVSSLFDLHRYGTRPGTDACRDLLAELSDPHADLTAVQIAGSNGKGSTARMLESVLREAGLTVGTFTSPHLEDVRERVRIDGRPIRRAELTAFVERIDPIVTDRAQSGAAPTFFEAVTALALWAFDRHAVDVAILEVGIGGRYDATSVVDPAASAITTVTLEHTDTLGETIPEIARDMAAVAPTDRPLVTATSGEARAVIDDETAITTVGGPDDDVCVTDHGREGLRWGVGLSGGDWSVETTLDLLGPHQTQNAGVAAALARQIAAPDERAITDGLARATWPGRFEVLDRDPLVVLDGAHNPGACERLRETLAAFEFDRLHIVVGAMADKDHRGMAEALPEADRIVATRPANDRAETPTVLSETLGDAHPGATRVIEPDVEDALEVALAGAEPSDAVVLAGSLYAVAEARSGWTRTVVEPRIDDDPSLDALFDRASVADNAIDARQRTLHTRLPVAHARALDHAIESAGGSCWISGYADRTGPVDVVVMATEATVRRALNAADLPTTVENRLRDRIGRAGAGEVAPDWPWADDPAIMGILNVTPDSFHDGGEYDEAADAIDRAREMIANGADIVDVGGESTRPGADPVDAAVERDRVVPVIDAIADDVCVSVDTRKASVARAALAAGADIVNDVSGLEDPAMVPTVADSDAGVVVMDSADTPVDPTRSVAYDDVVRDVIDALRDPVLRAERAGIDRDRILVDPGLGFGKTAAESFALLDRIDEFHALGCPVMVGHSQKSMFEAVDRPAGDCPDATQAGTTLAVARGADVIRVHDVERAVIARDVVETAHATRFDH
ncbi:dihydropteroate synthase [Halococcoides cellulosivorans]|uniref:Probable bifunctional folylpolyglutamate synthase/dihydropteroate synthase n=1 Tax=Halococcoides cellulosivorans TaxID=1679096 RepID=A0A2R4X4D4_9EURY|nr:dihydropteroate synthase [Halococcoides cellulosivorans]AWB28661.1 dihydropteroate synthase [Halococcoides cellulosivorans]